jgi:mycofactocin system transcriptional regulator
MGLFASHGFGPVTVDQIASASGVSRRTFFRYFDSKSAVMWHDFDTEVGALREELRRVDGGVGLMDAIRAAVVRVNRYRVADVEELRLRMQLIGSDAALQASAAVHYDAWERAVSDFAATRLGDDADALVPLAIGRATLAVCRAAFDVWVRSADADLARYLDRALAALGEGFGDQLR